LDDDFFDRFSRPQGPRDYVQRGLGSGMIASDDDHVLTNNRIGGDADEVSVMLSDNRTFTAEVVGTDLKPDFAVIKIDASNLPPANLGDSDQVKTGEWLVAAGNPFGSASSIAAGIASAKRRANVGIAK
jgi:serine protease Do